MSQNGVSKAFRKFLDQKSHRRRPIEAIFVAGEDLTDYSAVYLDSEGAVLKFDSTNALLNRRCIGITGQKTAKEGYPVLVVMYGELDIPGSGFTPGEEYFAVEDGQIADTFPLPGLAVKVGVAVTPTTILVDVDHQEPQGDPFNLYATDYTVTGAVDGVNTSYTTTAQFSAGTLRVFYNGQRLHLTDDYTVTGVNSFEMEWAPEEGKIWAEYIPV